ncbi:elongator complex protein 4-like isoform X3 [Ipomoea triloba]|uniref:elongator complex protein 4-like isoform X3 n=1 Tax=Ipomoea triloba TaxID=35885 RepID=UPI00125DA42B|nr:elongator complex protein 4-like isoform X3 [Ipomoea triloba]
MEGIADISTILWLQTGLGLAVSLVTLLLLPCPRFLDLSMAQMAQCFFHLAYLISTGIVHKQSLLYASPERDPRSFLGTLPSLMSSKDDKSRERDTEQDKGLRIAWQYKKYFGEQNSEVQLGGKAEYCNDFDLRKPLERHFLSGQRIDCISLQDFPNLDPLRQCCSTFLAQIPRCDGNMTCTGRIAIQSLCAPQCKFSNNEWDILSFIRSLKCMIRSSNAVAVISFPSSLISPSSLKRWQHLADTLISVRPIPDEDKDLAKLLTGYQDMLGLLNVHKVAHINTQVPVILEATTFSIKLHKRRSLILECLNQAPVDGSSGASYGSSGNCSGSSKTGNLDF